MGDRGELRKRGRFRKVDIVSKILDITKSGNREEPLIMSRPMISDMCNGNCLAIIANGDR